MSSKQFVAFSDSFNWARRGGIPSGLLSHVAPHLNFCQKGWQYLAPRLRLGLYALAFLFGGALLFIFTGLCTIVVFADDHCGPRFGYYGCGVADEIESLNDSRGALEKQSDAELDWGGRRGALGQEP
jgi:hypothetical protein